MTLRGRIGVTLSFGDWRESLAAAPELEQLGYAAIWISGGRLDDLSRVAATLRATRHVPVGTGIIPVDVFSSDSVATAYTEIEADHPGRFLVGLGGAHGPNPRQTLSDYLNRIGPAVPADRCLLAALGPRMLTLAGERTAGAFPLLATPEYTARARARLGPQPTLVVQHPVVVDTDAARARAAGRWLLDQLAGVTGYRAHFHRMGFTEEDGTGSDRIVDALVSWGDPDSIAVRVGQHLDAGADQVAVTVLATEADGRAPLRQWRRLAEVLISPELR
ncbi:TIGR03620 family F420-dependent LLM class oxidoreductase [Saccharopolyspora sp. SCSIO 74807]|uniref:TIGR03620 family F420-dependent LLM class oxidoreductase n=1 Tax=Saccharopolyspora sp. SCSIO 74807 TaxID=3118084 RepID=UPI0030CBA0C5